MRVIIVRVFKGMKGIVRFLKITSLCGVCVCCLSEEDFESLGTLVTHCGSKETNLGLLQQVLLKCKATSPVFPFPFSSLSASFPHSRLQTRLACTLELSCLSLLTAIIV